MRITPTPRAMSPHDIVRIYVPPPPPEELYDRPNDLRLLSNHNHNISSEGRSPESDCRTIIQRTPTELPGSVSTATITSQSLRSLNQSHQHQQQYQERGRNREEGGVGGLEDTLRDLALYSSQNSLKGHGSTSSSRRGSMSRKSSVLVESELASECPHIRVTSGRDSRKNSLTQRHSCDSGSGVVNAEYEAILARANSNKPKKEPRVMTSFEKLAQMNDTFYFGGSPSHAAELESREGSKKPQQSDDEAYSYRGSRGQGKERNGQSKKCTSDYNIQYKANGAGNGATATAAEGSGGGGDQVGFSGGGRNGEGDHTGHGDVKEPTNKKNKKQYDRFFTPDESEEEDDEVPSVGAGGVGKKKRSAGGGGGHKSLLATPVNDTQPLIMPDTEAVPLQYHFRHEQIPRRRTKQLETDADEDGYDDAEDDDECYGGEISSSPTYAATGKVANAYYAHRSSRYIPISEEYGGSAPVEGGGNKIRIRVNEKNK